MNTDKIEIPIGYEQDGDIVVLFNTSDTDKLIGANIGIVVQGDSVAEAKRQYLLTLSGHIQWLEKRSRELEKWKPFQKGDWKHIGGKWFTIFGINVYFRTGKGMKGGWYVPFTKLNVKIFNHWKK